MYFNQALKVNEMLQIRKGGYMPRKATKPAEQAEENAVENKELEAGKKKAGRKTTAEKKAEKSEKETPDAQEKADDELYTDEMLDAAENEIESRENERKQQAPLNPQLEEIMKMISSIAGTNVLTEKQRSKQARKNKEKDILYDDEVATASDQIRDEIEAISDAYKITTNKRQAPRILYGKVTSVLNEPNMPIMVSVIPENMRGFVKIRIPDMLFLAPSIYKDFKVELSDDEATKELKRKYLQDELVAYIGANVAFVIQQFDEPEKLAIANRLVAMDLLTKLNYIRPDKRDKDGRPRVFEGLKVAAEVIAVRKDRIRVNVQGVDTTIHSGRDLSSVALQSLPEEFKNGDKFYVKVKEIKNSEVKVDRKYNLREIVVSKTEGEPKESDLFFSSFTIGQICGATVKRIEDGSVFVRLENKMDAMCPIPTVCAFHPGDIVNVIITKMEDDTKFIYGKVI